MDKREDCANLILNMKSGLLPENLSKDEILLLIEIYGSDWFHILGYTEPQYKKPPKLYKVTTEHFRAYDGETGEELFDWRWDKPSEENE